MRNLIIPALTIFGTSLFLFGCSPPPLPDEQPVVADGDEEPAEGEGETGPPEEEGEPGPEPGEGEGETEPGEGEGEHTPEPEPEPAEGEGETEPAEGEGETEPAEGEGEPPQCEEDTFVCSEDQRYRMRCQNGEWVDEEPCDDDHICKAHGDGSTECVPAPDCDDGEMDCWENKKRKCRDGEWNEEEDCADDGMICQLNEDGPGCVAPPECALEGAKRCPEDDPTSYQICAEGQWWSHGCNVGVCETDSDGEASCQAECEGANRICDDNFVGNERVLMCQNGRWTENTDCAPGICEQQNGASAECVDAECEGGWGCSPDNEVRSCADGRWHVEVDCNNNVCSVEEGGGASCVPRECDGNTESCSPDTNQRIRCEGGLWVVQADCGDHHCRSNQNGGTHCVACLEDEHCAAGGAGCEALCQNYQCTVSCPDLCQGFQYRVCQDDSDCPGQGRSRWDCYRPPRNGPVYDVCNCNPVDGGIGQCGGNLAGGRGYCVPPGGWPAAN